MKTSANSVAYERRKSDRNSQAPPSFGGHNRAFPISRVARLGTKMNRIANKPESAAALAGHYPASSAEREGVLGSYIGLGARNPKNSLFFPC